MDTIEWVDFEKVQLLVGTIVEASPFPEAKKAAYKTKKIGPFISEVLTTGLVLGDEVVLAIPERKVPNGSKLA